MTTMNVLINNKEVAIAAGVSTLAELLVSQGFDRPGLAVAVDNKVVRKAEWGERAVTDGMKITVVRAVCGG